MPKANERCAIKIISRDNRKASSPCIQCEEEGSRTDRPQCSQKACLVHGFQDAAAFPFVEIRYIPNFMACLRTRLLKEELEKT